MHHTGTLFTSEGRQGRSTCSVAAVDQPVAQIMHDLTGQQLLFRPGIMDTAGYPFFKSSCSMTRVSAVGVPVCTTIFLFFPDKNSVMYLPAELPARYNPFAGDVLFIEKNLHAMHADCLKP